MGLHKGFGPNYSLLQGASFLCVSLGVLAGNNLQVAWPSFCRNYMINNPALLQDLKELVTIKPSPQMSTPTGIPPHVNHPKHTTSCLKLCRKKLDVKKAIYDDMESKAFVNGIVTTQSLGEMLELHHKQMDEPITDRLKALQSASTPTETVTPTPVIDKEGFKFAPGTIDDKDEEAAPRLIVHSTYSHSGQFWHTPRPFALPPGMKFYFASHLNQLQGLGRPG
jgi:hypothetical protein